jgi:hypothetical protein
MFHAEFKNNVFIIYDIINLIYGYFREKEHLITYRHVWHKLQLFIEETWSHISGPYIKWRRSRGSSVSIVSDYGLDDRSSIPERGKGIFF